MGSFICFPVFRLLAVVHDVCFMERTFIHFLSMKQTSCTTANNWSTGKQIYHMYFVTHIGNLDQKFLLAFLKTEEVNLYKLFNHCVVVSFKWIIAFVLIMCKSLPSQRFLCSRPGCSRHDGWETPCRRKLEPFPDNNCLKFVFICSVAASTKWTLGM